MPSDADQADSSLEGKQSKRALFKNALARTKSKFKRDEEDKDFTLSDDVNDFLAAGKQTHEDDRLPIAPSLNSTSDLPPRHPSPRGVPMPRLDVSQSTRFPAARTIPPPPAGGGVQDFLRPVERPRERSQSFGSFKNTRRRPRNLSVNFDNKPPVIIGLGGDDAEQPPIEISRLRHTKSLSPMPQQRPGSNHSHSSHGSVSSLRRKPVASYANPFDDDNTPHIRPLQRVPTGFDNIKSPADQEYEMSLGRPSPNSNLTGPAAHFQTPLVSPKPIHPPVPPPQVRSPPLMVPEPPSSHAVRSNIPSGVIGKQGTVQVVVTDEDFDDRLPTLPNVKLPPPIPKRKPNAAPVMPHQKMPHRHKPSLNETETMNHGASGWL